MRSIVHKIRNVGDDILDVMEKAGGHTLEMHVAKINDELILRAIQSEVGGATSFSNKRIAINAVKENLKNNAEKIATWLTDNTTKRQTVFEFSHQYSIGSGVSKGKKIPTYDLNNSRIVLVKDPTYEFGFKILTAFPIIY